MGRQSLHLRCGQGRHSGTHKVGMFEQAALRGPSPRTLNGLSLVTTRPASATSSSTTPPNTVMCALVVCQAKEAEGQLERCHTR